MNEVSYQEALNLAGRQRMLNQRAIKEALACKLGQTLDPQSTLTLLEQSGRALQMGGEAQGASGSGKLPKPPTDALFGAMEQANRAYTELRKLLEGFLADQVPLSALLSHGDQVHTKANHVCTLYANAIDELLARQTQESQRILEACQRGELDFRGETLGLAPSVRGPIESTNAVLDAVLAPIPQALEVLAKVGQGDLRERIDTSEYVGDHARLAQGVNQSVETLNDLLWDLRPVSEEVADQAHTLQATALHLATSTQEQGGSIEEVDSLLKRLVSGLDEHAQVADKAAELATTSDETLRGSSEHLSDFLGSIQSLEEGVERIANFLTVIDDIAFQTDLLALNAAVEAARAGNHGNGFAVVAQEVRALALRSSKASSQMEEVVSLLDRNMSRAESLANTTARELQEVSAASARLGTHSHTLAQASKQQVEEIRRTQAAMSELRTTSEDGQRAARQVAGASKQLSAGAQRLQQLQGRFELAPQTAQPVHGFDPELVAKVREWLERGAA